MIKERTILKVSDNSGAKTVRCIRVLDGFKKSYATIGDTIVVSVQKLRNKAKNTSKVKKKEIYSAIVLRTKKTKIYKNGFKIRFEENAVALLNKQGNPVGTRIMGPLIKNLKLIKNQKLISLAIGII
jgi:large subunit ribosomal protein L14